jgi:predicted phosphoribosyltransferase
MFRDRDEAGRLLAERLKEVDLRNPLVLGIPRGGAVTAAALAHELCAEFDVVLARKLRSPIQPELAFGAIGEDGQIYLNHAVETATGVTPEYLEHERRHQMQEIERRRQLFRAARPAAVMSDRSVILTDDGIATGSTMFAAMEVVKSHRPYELIVAVPVAPPSRLDDIRVRCDRLICLAAPEAFWAVGQFYEAFEPVEDDEVLALLREFAPQSALSESRGGNG